MSDLMDKQPGKRWSQGAAGGAILILVGLAALLGHWLDIGSSLVLLLGVTLLVWGAISRTGGWLIPGGVLAGIGLGILVNEGPWHLPVEMQNGLFLLCFAFGWLSIALLSRLALRCTMWWALIPGGTMALLGAAVLLGAENLAALLWPVGMIIVGLFLVWRWGQAKIK